MFYFDDDGLPTWPLDSYTMRLFLATYFLKLLTHVVIQGCLLYIFCYILYYFIYFLAQKSPPLWSLCQASFWVHCHLQDKYSAFILYTFCLVLESVIYPWNHGSFYWSMELDARSWALHVLTCSGTMFFFFFFILKILGYIRYLWILLATAMYVCYLQINIQEYIRSMQTIFNSCIMKSSWQLCSKILPLTEPVLTNTSHHDSRYDFMFLREPIAKELGITPQPRTARYGFYRATPTESGAVPKKQLELCICF